MKNGEFDEFFKVYPRRVRPAKARRAFAWALKQASIERILEGVANYRRWIDESGTEEKFVAHPATWLYAEGWTDEYGTVKPAGQGPRPPTLEEISKWGKE